MPSLKYKPEGINPRGKPWVYFCAHKDDFAKYFDIISDEILSKESCVIWYKENGGIKSDDFTLDLLEMNLFIMPVTRKLLTSKNDALDFEFNFAIEHHIPVLPLMQEGGLEGLFNQKCGELQFLDKYKIDNTAISYDEKLTKYLKSVLIGDELAEKIRSSFDAYIFLSYRKKDRKYANELMRLIHKNDFCRDIAIWYDEFLTPGENFNKSINDALEKSCLFLLAVTPSLVNETNYIMTTEYPIAIESGKPILPAEMIKTNRKKLEKKYEKIPDCINARQEPALSDSLFKELKNVAPKEKTPERNYLIGLAYLSGVDVEIDSERALSLITSAAEQGCAEAAEKLAWMYRNGNGVLRNRDSALKWQKKYADCRQALCIEDYESLNAYFWAVADLYEYQFELGALEDAINSAERMLAVCERAKGKYNFSRNTSFAYMSLGLISDLTGDTEKAKKFYNCAVVINSALASSNPTIENLNNLALSRSMIVSRLIQQDELDSAEKLCRQALEAYLRVDYEIGSPQSKQNVIICYMNLGLIEDSRGKHSSAKVYYRAALNLLEEQTAKVSMPRLELNLALCYNMLGEYEKFEGELSLAKDYYERALSVCEELLKKTDLAEVISWLSMLYGNLGNIAEDEGNKKRARAYYEKGIEIAKRAVNEIGSHQTYSFLGCAYLNMAEFTEDVSYLQKAYDIFKVLCELCPSDTHYKETADELAQLLGI